MPLKESTVNRDLTTVHAVLRHAMPQFRAPADLFFPENHTRVRYLDDATEARALAAVAPGFDRMVRLGKLTLMRNTEIRTLRREYVHLAAGVALLPKAKGGPGTVVLNREAKTLLEEQLASHESEWVFPSPTGGPYSRGHFSRRWREAARRISLGNFTLHDWRHHGATKALKKSKDPEAVRELLRVTSAKMMRRYAPVTDESRRAAAEML